MKRSHHPLAKVLALLALGAAALVPAAAQGAPPPQNPPLINDAVGDPGYLCFDTLLGVPARCGREVPQPDAPAVDITQGNISHSSAGLEFETTVVDLDDPAVQDGTVTQYAMGAVTGNVRIRVNAERTLHQGSSFGTVTVENWASARSVTGPVGLAFDDTADTVRWTVDMGDLNDSITHVCPECEGLGRGDLLTQVYAETSQRENWALMPPSDRAYANRDYVIGDD